MRTLGPLVRLLLALLGVLVTVGAAVTMLVPRRGLPSAEPATLGQLDWALALVLMLAAVALMMVGGAAWFARRGGLLALVAIWAAAAWLAPELVGASGVPREVRSTARLLAPLVTPLLVHVVAIGPAETRLGRPALFALVACSLVAGVTAIGHAVTWDVYRVLSCPAPCLPDDNVILIRSNIALSQLFLAVWAGLTAVSGALLVIRQLVLIARRRPHGLARWTAMLGGCLVGIAMAWWGIDHRLGDGWARIDATGVPPMAAMSISITLMGTALAAVLVMEIRRMGAVRDLAALVGPGLTPTAFESVLATSLGDPGVRVAYPLDDGGLVDVRGDRVESPLLTAGQRQAIIERRGVPVAIVVHADHVDAELLTRGIGTAASLAVDNERLDAIVRARIRELRESRARIVSAADATRSAIERDLHDGAQQRLLAVSYELRLTRAATTDPDLTAALDDAVQRLDAALSELRDLAHGIHPAVLSEAGLDAALRSLAEEASLPIEIHADVAARCPTTSEAAAYFAVVEAARRATDGGSSRLDVGLAHAEGLMRMRVDYAAQPDDEGWERVEDRVGAAGGHAAITNEMGTLMMRLELPCA